MSWFQFDFKYEDTARLLFAIVIVVAGTLLGWSVRPALGATVCIFLAFVALFALGLHLQRRVERDRAGQLEHLQYVQYLFSKIDFRTALAPLTGWSASPRLACTLYDLVKRHQPEVIVEIGSGVSTVVMAYALDQNGKGRVISLEHDADYARRVRRDLVRHGLAHRVEVVHAPLGPVTIEDRSFRWYDFAAADHLGESRIDLLVVDGPPRETQPEARYPAVPRLDAHLSSRAIVVLDDASRGDEQSAVRQWEAKYGLHLSEMITEGKGIAVLEKPSSA